MRRMPFFVLCGFAVGIVVGLIGGLSWNKSEPDEVQSLPGLKSQPHRISGFIVAERPMDAQPTHFQVHHVGNPTNEAELMRSWDGGLIIIVTADGSIPLYVKRSERITTKDHNGP